MPTLDFKILFFAGFNICRVDYLTCNYRKRVNPEFAKGERGGEGRRADAWLMIIFVNFLALSQNLFLIPFSL